METKHQYHQKSETGTSTYQCPMMCEGDKTYDQPGNCPVCNMYLKPVNES